VIEHECHHCSAAFYTHQQLSKHVHYVHSGNWNNVDPPKNLVGCVICGQGFEDQAKMMQHIIMHRMDGTASKEQILRVLDENLTPPEECVTYVIQEEP